MNSISDYDQNTPVNESLYVDEIKEIMFIGFPIKNNYDHSRFVIPERYNPKRIKFDGKCFYGIWADNCFYDAWTNNDAVVNVIRYSDKILALTFGDGEQFLLDEYKNFDTIVYKESPVEFYHKLAQMYIYVFLP